MSKTKPRRNSKGAEKKRAGSRAKQQAQSPFDSLSHQECDSLLEFYISSETRGEDAAKLYPAVARHLLLCQRCRTSYSLVRDALAQPAAEKDARAGQTAMPPPAFLPTAEGTAAWKKMVRSPIAGAPIGFGFAIQRQHLLASISPSAATGLRGESSSDQAPLLLSDTVALGRRQVMVEMRTAQTHDPDHIEVRVSIVPSTPLPDPVRAVLKWNQEQRSAILQDGKCSFDAIPVSAVEKGGDIHIEFSAGEELEKAK